MLRGKVLARGVGPYTASVQTDPPVLLAMKPILDVVEVYPHRGVFFDWSISEFNAAYQVL
jgi:hypothetical protein